ncbi:hypothetical protein F4780DRAFT_767272 [Xylariomycetidae sp. FL0641]|nr:hypothetical protein F4780DRAFT_767272 [Xylariomycetidae sp. FL0641]
MITCDYMVDLSLLVLLHLLCLGHFAHLSVAKRDRCLPGLAKRPRRTLVVIVQAADGEGYFKCTPKPHRSGRERWKPGPSVFDLDDAVFMHIWCC